METEPKILAVVRHHLSHLNSLNSGSDLHPPHRDKVKCPGLPDMATRGEPAPRDGFEPRTKQGEPRTAPATRPREETSFWCLIRTMVARQMVVSSRWSANISACAYLITTGQLRSSVVQGSQK